MDGTNYNLEGLEFEETTPASSTSKSADQEYDLSGLSFEGEKKNPISKVSSPSSSVTSEEKPSPYAPQSISKESKISFGSPVDQVKNEKASRVSTIKNDTVKTLDLEKSDVLKKKMVQDLMHNDSDAYSKKYVDVISSMGYNKNAVSQFADKVNKAKQDLKDAETILTKKDVVPFKEQPIYDQSGMVVGKKIVSGRQPKTVEEEKASNASQSFKAANALLTLENPDAAINMFNQALGNLTSKTERTERQAVMQGDPRFVSKEYNPAFNPAYSFNGLGAAYLKKKDYPKALEYFQQALDYYNYKSPEKGAGAPGEVPVKVMPVDGDNNALSAALDGVSLVKFLMGDKAGSKDAMSESNAIKSQNTKEYALTNQISAESADLIQKQKRSEEIGGIHDMLETFISGYDPENKLGTLGYLNFPMKWASGIQEGGKTIGEGFKEMGDNFGSGLLTTVEGLAGTAFASVPQITQFNAGISAIKDAASVLPKEGQEAISSLLDLPFQTATLFANSLGYNPDEKSDAAKLLRIADIALSFKTMELAHGGSEMLKNAPIFRDVKSINDLKDVLENVAKKGDPKEIQQVNTYVDYLKSLKLADIKKAAEKSGDGEVVNKIDNVQKQVPHDDLHEKLAQLKSDVQDENGNINPDFQKLSPDAQQEVLNNIKSIEKEIADKELLDINNTSKVAKLESSIHDLDTQISDTEQKMSGLNQATQEVVKRTLNDLKEKRDKLKSEYDQMKGSGEVKGPEEKLEWTKDDQYEFEILSRAEKNNDLDNEEKLTLNELKQKKDAIQKQSPGGVLQYPQEGVGETRSERGGMEQGVQGNETAIEGEEIPSKANEGEVAKEVGARVKLKDAPEGNHLNIGLKVGKTDEMMSENDILSKLPNDVSVVSSKVIEGTEPSVSIETSRPLTDAEMIKLMDDTKQEAIPQVSNGEGVLYDKMRGTKEAWGEFNPEYFVMQDGKSLTEKGVTVKSEEIEPSFSARALESGTKEEFIEAKKNELREADELNETFEKDGLYDRIFGGIYDKERGGVVEQTLGNIDNVKSALKSIAPNLEVKTYDTIEQMEAAAKDLGMSPSEIKRAKNAGGFFDGKDIHLNLQKIRSNTLFHEGVHPILNAIHAIDTKAIDRLFEQVKTVEKRLGVEGKYTVEFAGEYAKDKQKMEAVTEFIADVADGKIKITESNFDKIKQIFVDMMKAIGIDVSSIKTVGELKNLADKINKSFKLGEEIKIKPTEEIIKDRQYQSVSLMKGSESMKKYGLDKYKNVTRKIGEALEKRQREKYGFLDQNDRSESAKEKISNWMVDEMKYFIDTMGEKSGKGWYGEKYQKSLDAMSKIFPEMKSDQGARDLFTMLVAITSDGQKVITNFKLASQAYDYYKKNGKLPENLPGQREASFKSNLKKINDLLVQYNGDASAIKKDLMKIKSIEDINKERKKDGLPPLKTDWPVSFKAPFAASVFGPKLGMFFSNLSGNEAYPTLDRWWSRTFNRYRGTLIPEIKKGITSKGERIGLDRFKELLNDINMSDEEALLASKSYRDSYKNKGYKNGTEIEKAANTIYKIAYENLNDAPFNKTDREFMYNAVSDAVNKMNRKGYDISIADAQAVLWYYEKNLYKKLGVQAKIEGISYEDAANKTYDKWKENNNSFDYKISEKEEGQSIENEDYEIEKDDSEVNAGKEVDFQASKKGKKDLISGTPKEKYMTDDGEGNYVFYHYSAEDLTRKGINPEKFGKNLATGRDERPAVPQSFYYTEHDALELNVPHDFGHAVRIPKDKVYPFNEDPLNLLPEAEKLFRKENPNRAFDLNNQVAYVDKVARGLGYKMTVADWNIKGRKALRAQSGEAFKPELATRTVPGTLNQTEDLGAMIKSNRYKRNIGQSAKTIADNIRKGKLGGNGAKMSLPLFEQAWDGSLEVVAKAIEVGGDVVEAIEKGIEYLKNTDYYKGLPDKLKATAEKKLRSEINRKIPAEAKGTAEMFDALDKMREDISNGEGNRKLKKREIQQYLENNPEIAYIDKNFSLITKQLETLGELKKSSAECP